MTAQAAVYVLGLNAFHADSSACLFKDGRLVAAAEEERFLRRKHWAGFPAESVRYCLEHADIDLRGVGHIAINSDPLSNLWRKLLRIMANPGIAGQIAARIRNAKARLELESALDEAMLPGTFTGRVHRVNHHLAHLASAFLVSPFQEAVCVSVDGFGDFSSAAWGLGRGSDLRLDGQVRYPHSLGIFYQALTQYLGFPHYGDEYKVMGLAPYGEPRHLDAMRDIVRRGNGPGFELNLDYFTHHEGGFEYRWDGGLPVVGPLYSEKLTRRLGPARGEDQALEPHHKDLARSLQARYEEVLFGMLNSLHQRYGLDTLALAGGCAMNSVANGKIYAHTPFRRVYVQAAAGDAGGAIGAAAWACRRVMRGERPPPMEHAYWGPDYDDDALAAIIESMRPTLSQSDCRVRSIEDQSELCGATAGAISEGLVVGWFQGRMEWGPRALGNRSIVCDPRRADMKDILNRKIKRRESFRPFAPSVMRDHVSEWFETEDDVPFMMQVFKIREEKRELIPAVTHVDGSGRLQTVTASSNPRYFHLIDAFHRRTGVPMILNTSFNENEPIVCTPEQAIDCFVRTDMDWLVLGSHLITRQ
ncbi:MAG TPA: carbamoyltransferase C-terminal domain-containing protein [Gammaproteobacteria bacterium]|nr:carbamoyltransferase C-terminal domain-containing protein [Gammaproteobacteria bacterium]